MRQKCNHLPPYLKIARVAGLEEGEYGGECELVNMEFIF